MMGLGLPFSSVLGITNLLTGVDRDDEGFDVDEWLPCSLLFTPQSLVLSLSFYQGRGSVLLTKTSIIGTTYPSLQYDSYSLPPKSPPTTKWLDPLLFYDGKRVKS